jgi:hypothetical protein
MVDVDTVVSVVVKKKWLANSGLRPIEIVGVKNIEVRKKRGFAFV